MELKEMIAELRDLSAGWVHGSGHVPVSAAAEALALVAWAEEKRISLVYWRGTWSCLHHESTTLLGCIRAAKEAYEAE